MDNYGLGIAAFGTILLIALCIGLIPLIFYLITLQRALQTVSPENRKMEPGLVWLLIIPFFSLIWNYFVVDAIGISFKKEYEKYGMMQSEKPTYSLGLTLAILQCCCIIPILGSLAALGALVVWIIYWVKVYQTKTELVNIQANYHIEDGQKSIFV